MSFILHTKRRQHVAVMLASRRKRGGLTLPAVVARRDEPAVLRSSRREANGFLASAPLKASRLSRSTRPHKSRLSLRSHHETVLPARVTPGGDQQSQAKCCSRFDGITTRDSRRRQCGKPGRDPGRITTWLAGYRRQSPPPSRGENSANVFHHAFLARGGNSADRTYGK